MQDKTTKQPKSETKREYYTSTVKSTDVEWEACYKEGPVPLVLTLNLGATRCNWSAVCSSSAIWRSSSGVVTEEVREVGMGPEHEGL